MSTEPTHVPEALYSCAYRACAEENSFPAEHLHWAGDKWLCFSCCAHDGVTKGVSLADHLARKQPAADLAGYPVDVVNGMAQFAADQRPPDPEAAAILEECQSELMADLPALCEECTEEPCTNPLCPCAEPVHSADPITVALREAIPAEDVPEWAVWVAVDDNGDVYAYEREPRAGKVWNEWIIPGGRHVEHQELCRFDTLRMKNIDWRTTKRRVADVWKGDGE